MKYKILIILLVLLLFSLNGMSGLAYDPYLDRECLIIYPEKYERAAYALKQYHEGDVGKINGPKIGTGPREDLSAPGVTVEWINANVGDNLDDYLILWADPPDSLTSGGGYSNASLDWHDTINNYFTDAADNKYFYYNLDLARRILGYIQALGDNDVLDPDDVVSNPDLLYIVLLGNNLEIPPSYYVYLPVRTPIGTTVYSGNAAWQPTDFFYSLDTYTRPDGSQNLIPAYSVGRLPVVDVNGYIDSGVVANVITDTVLGNDNDATPLVIEANDTTIIVNPDPNGDGDCSDGEPDTFPGFYAPVGSDSNPSTVEGERSLGWIKIGLEEISYEGVTTTTINGRAKTTSFTGCVRGANGTTAAAHSAGDAVTDGFSCEINGAVGGSSKNWWVDAAGGTKQLDDCVAWFDLDNDGTKDVGEIFNIDDHDANTIVSINPKNYGEVRTTGTITTNTSTTITDGAGIITADDQYNNMYLVITLPSDHALYKAIYRITDTVNATDTLILSSVDGSPDFSDFIPSGDPPTGDLLQRTYTIYEDRSFLSTAIVNNDNIYILHRIDTGTTDSISYNNDTELTTITDTKREWVPNIFTGKILHITRGRAWGEVYTIILNTVDTITVSGNLPGDMVNANVSGDPPSGYDTFEILDTSRDEAERLCGDGYNRNTDANFGKGGMGGKFENWWKYWTAGSHDTPGDDVTDWFKNLALAGGNYYNNWRYEGEMGLLELINTRDTKDDTLNPNGDGRSYLSGMNIQKYFATNYPLPNERYFTKSHVSGLLGSAGSGTSVDKGMAFLFGYGFGVWRWEGSEPVGEPVGVYLECSDDLITSTDVLGYRSADQKIPLVLSPANYAASYEMNPFYPLGRPPSLYSQSFGQAVLLSHNIDSPTNLGGGIAFIGFNRGTQTAFTYETEEGKTTNHGVLRMNREKYEDYAPLLLHYVFKQYHQGGNLVANLFTRAIQDFIEKKGEKDNNGVLQNISGVLDASWNEKALFSFTLLGDPCTYIPVQEPWASTQESTTPEVRTLAPGVSPGGPRQRNDVPSYNSYDIPVYEVEDGGTVSITITPAKGGPVIGGRTMDASSYEVKLVDPRNDETEEVQILSPGETYTFTVNDYEDSDNGINGPSVYIVRVSSKEDAATGTTTYARENRIYIEVVNKFFNETAGVRHPAKDILVIDDDQRDHCRILDRPWWNHDDYEDLFNGPLDAKPYTYDVWHVDNDEGGNARVGDPEGDYDFNGRHGEVTLEVLKRYVGSGKVVIWFTGDDYRTTLTPEDQATLATFLDLGGNLFITGQVMPFDLHYTVENLGWILIWTEATNSFHADYLHASYVRHEFEWWNSILLFNLDGVLGDPVTNNIYNVNIEGGTGGNNQWAPNEIKPLSPATAILYYDETGGTGNIPAGVGGIKVDTGTYRVVYFSFGFEGIDNATHPINGRNVIMKGIIDWLKTGGAETIAVTIATTPDPPEGDPPLSIAFDSTSSGGTGNYAWLWDFGDGTTSNEEDPTHTYNTPGIYTVTLTVNDTKNNTGTAAVTVTVRGLTASISTSPSPASGGVPLAVTFTGSAGDGSDPDLDSVVYSWAWNFGDGSSESGNGGTYRTRTHTYTAEGKTYTVTLTVTDSGSGETAQSTVGVNTGGLQAYFNADPTSGDAPLAVTFKGFVSGGSAPYIYSWDFDGNGIEDSTMENPTYTYTSSGSYSAKLTVLDRNNASSTAYVTISVSSGSGGGGGGGGGCFIATAAYGSPFANEVQVLSNFRDRFLLNNKLGKELIKFYYKHSPAWAKFIECNEVLKGIVRAGLKPFVWLIRMLGDKI